MHIFITNTPACLPGFSVFSCLCCGAISIPTPDSPWKPSRSALRGNLSRYHRARAIFSIVVCESMLKVACMGTDSCFDIVLALACFFAVRSIMDCIDPTGLCTIDEDSHCRYGCSIFQHLFCHGSTLLSTISFLLHFYHISLPQCTGKLDLQDWCTTLH